MSEHPYQMGQQTGWFRVILALVVTVEAVAVFFGLRDLMQPGTIAAGAIPIVTAIAVAGAFFLLWDYICRSIPAFSTPGRRMAGIALGSILMLATIAASSWFIAAAIGGDAATRVHQDTYITLVQAELDKAPFNAKLDQTIYTKALEVQAAFRDETGREKKFGSQSGKPGDGAVTALYNSVSESMGKLARLIDDKLTDSSETQKKALSLVKDMKQAASQKEFVQKATDVSSLLNKLDNISAVQDAMNYGVVTVDTKNGDLRMQVDNLTGELRRTAKATDDKRKKIEAPFYSPTSGALAIMEYPSASPGGWIVGVAIDIVPFLVLLLLVLNHAEYRDRQAAAEEGRVFSLRKPAE
jgi:hypothetical protein